MQVQMERFTVSLSEQVGHEKCHISFEGALNVLFIYTLA